jgi:hypothetical protein
MMPSMSASSRITMISAVPSRNLSEETVPEGTGTFAAVF